jgi:hypothetical protein
MHTSRAPDRRCFGKTYDGERRAHEKAWRLSNQSLRSQERDFEWQRQTPRNGPWDQSHALKRRSRRKEARQWRAFCVISGNLCDETSAWWAREDSNL